MSAAYSRLQMWGWIGVTVAMIHFGLSEGSYQLAERVNSDLLYQISDTVSWPAGPLYSKVEEKWLRAELERLSIGADLSAEVREKARELLKEVHADTFYEEASGFVTEQGISWEVSLSVEYAIYGGISVLWGLLAAVGGYGLFAAMYDADAESFS